ncbi:PP2C family protein-serine/threonine phosphatase [Curtobacterium sp. ZW137]|uniref:PP2C family protein-serine/threonine phosphatase n=1 Tax=Curtobacterium sp. ZW137 TaxID=2485104 RepID=UPI000F4B892C|nr:SpoIIE family protein phosphatase [Curtobacterium sp. ZW137]
MNRLLERWSLTPLVKQAPFALLIGMATVLSVTVPQLRVSNGGGLLTAIALTVVATIWAAAVTARPTAVSALVHVVPALDFIALGVLRWATGSSASVFTALVALPVVWLAAQEARRFVLYAALGTAVVILTPIALGDGLIDPTTELIRLGVVLVSYGTLAVVVNQLSRLHGAQLRRSQRREERVRAELEQAAAVQRSLLPKALGPVPGYSVAGTCLPARTVGGDFLDWYETDEGLAITLGDVMGKGVGSGLLAAAVRAVLRSSRADPDPAAAVARASQGLAIDPDGSGTVAGFTTLFHARVDGDRLLWVDAGHGLTVIARHDGSAERLASAQLPIGLGLGLEEHWTANETRLEPDDVLVCISDGVLDLFGGELDAVDHVAAIALEDTDPDTIVERLITLARSVDHDDDVTVMALRRSAVTAEADPHSAGRSGSQLADSR